jgi:pimeloyl-ACP methyl ester carboxylesterase
LVLHSEADEICPSQDGEAIAAAAPQGSILKVAGGDHLNLWNDPASGPAVAQACASFLRKFVSSTPQDRDPTLS